MTGPGNDDNRSAERLRALMSQAERPATPPMPEDIEDGDGPSDMPLDASLADVEWCATLDHSDTDNGKRLLRHRGQDLARMMEVGSEKATWAVWSERYWDAQDGAFQALAKAQAIGGLIGLCATPRRRTPRSARRWTIRPRKTSRPRTPRTPRWRSGRRSGAPLA